MLIELLIASAIIGRIMRYNLVLNHIGRIYISIYGIMIMAIIMSYKFREGRLKFIGVISSLVSFFLNGQKIVSSLKELGYVGLEEIVRNVIAKNSKLNKPRYLV